MNRSVVACAGAALRGLPRMNPNNMLKIQQGVPSKPAGYTKENSADMSLRCGIYIMHEARDANGCTINKKPQ